MLRVLEHLIAIAIRAGVVVLGSDIGAHRLDRAQLVAADPLVRKLVDALLGIEAPGAIGEDDGDRQGPGARADIGNPSPLAVRAQLEAGIGGSDEARALLARRVAIAAQDLILVLGAEDSDQCGVVLRREGIEQRRHRSFGRAEGLLRLTDRRVRHARGRQA